MTSEMTITMSSGWLHEKSHLSLGCFLALASLRCNDQESLPLGVKREFDGCSVAVELFQVVECSLLRKEYMDHNITCTSANC
jgi:hypothetical protein